MLVARSSSTASPQIIQQSLAAIPHNSAGTIGGGQVASRGLAFQGPNVDAE